MKTAKLKLYISTICKYTIVIIAYFLFYQRTEQLIDYMHRTIQIEISEQLEISIKKDEDSRGKGLEEYIFYMQTDNLASDHMVVITETDTTYTPKSKKNLSLDEKISKVKQTVLYNTNPIEIRILDSLLVAGLKENNIPAKVVVCIRDNLKASEQYSGSIPIVNKVLLDEPILLGARNELSIQVYYAIPGKYIVSQIPGTYWFSLSGWTLISMGLFLFPLKKYKIRKIRECQERTNSQGFYPDKICKELVPDLFYHPVYHQLIYKEQIFIFNGLSQRLLHAFIFKPCHLLTLEELKQQAWKRKFVTDDAVRTAISRLKEELKNIPSIRLVTITGTGYQMEFIRFPETIAGETDTDSLPDSPSFSVN